MDFLNLILSRGPAIVRGNDGHFLALTTRSPAAPAHAHQPCATRGSIPADRRAACAPPAAALLVELLRDAASQAGRDRASSAQSPSA